MTLSTADKVLQALQSYGLKPEGPGKYRANSPLRPGSNSHAFTLLIEDGEHGAYHDFASDEKGSLYDLAKKLNIEIERAEVEDTKRKYRDLLDYANAHGVSADVFAKAGWRMVTKDNRPALQFNTATGDRFRFLDGEKPPYKSIQGYKKCWYGAARAIALIDKDHPFVICNGEASTVVAQHYGIAASCVTSGEGKIPDDLIRELDGKLWGTPAETPILIALDCDTKGRAAALQIQAQLHTFGFVQARAVDLRLGDHGDLADFCMLHEQEAPKLLLTLPSLEDRHVDEMDEEDDPLRLIDIMDFGGLPKVKWIITGEIPERSFVMLYGESNVGKSFIAIDYALRIAKQAPVIYIALEGETGIPLRVYAWCQHHRVNPAQLQFKLLIGNVSLFDRESVDRLVAIMKPVCPYFVIVDTMRLAIGDGDENRAADMVRIFRGSKRLVRKMGNCTLMFVHHTNKGGSQEAGSAAFRARMDTVMQVLPDDDLVRLESSKTRDLEKFEPKSFKLLPITVEGEGATLVPIPAEQYVRGNEVTPDQRKVLEILAMELYTGGVSQRELEELTRLQYGRVVRALNNLVKKGFVSKPGAGVLHHTITNDGRLSIGLEAVEETEPNENVDRSKRGGSGQKSKPIQNSSPVDRLDRVDHTESMTQRIETVDRTQNNTDPADPPDPHGEKVDRSTPPPDPLFETSMMFEVGEIPTKPNHQYTQGL